MPYRCQVMIQFHNMRPTTRTPDPFFESRTWHYFEKEPTPDEKQRILEELDDEAWYQLITVPSLIDAYKKDTIYVTYGEEGCVPIGDGEVEGEYCTTYRYMINYKSNYEFTHERIECDIKRIEQKMKELTITDFTGKPVHKNDIIRWMRLGYWERVFVTLYRVWKEARNCETDSPFIWW